MFEASEETANKMFIPSESSQHEGRSWIGWSLREFYLGETSTFGANVSMFAVTEARPISLLANIGSLPVIRRIR